MVLRLKLCPKNGTVILTIKKLNLLRVTSFVDSSYNSFTAWARGEVLRCVLKELGRSIDDTGAGGNNRS